MGIPTGPAVLPHVGTISDQDVLLESSELEKKVAHTVLPDSFAHSYQDRSQSYTPVLSPVSVPLSVRSETKPQNPRSDSIKNQRSECTRDTDPGKNLHSSRGFQAILQHRQDVP